MAIARTVAELQRWSDLAIIRRAVAARMPELNDRAGLKDIAELCRRHTLAHPGRDWNDVRDGMLTIACEWDLAMRSWQRGRGAHRIPLDSSECSSSTPPMRGG